MKIIELVLDEEQEGSGVEAISIVESPAIEEDFVALKKEEIKLAEVSKDKKLLMGALLVPNKPIFRKSEKEEYYIYFSKDTILKASQLYLKNGNQNNSTLEHQHSLNGLTLVESWIVESETQDKSRLYNMNVPVGTWMGTVKVNNEDVWNEYVKTNKVKGFSIEGYFADKMERPKESIKEDMSEEKIAEQLLSKIESIVKGEETELATHKVELATDLSTMLNIVEAQLEMNKTASSRSNKIYSTLVSVIPEAKERSQINDSIIKGIDKKIQIVEKEIENVDKLAAELGVKSSAVDNYNKVLSELSQLKKTTSSLVSVNKNIQKLLK